MIEKDKYLNVIPAEEITSRFDKIERKLDALSDAMIALARNEEKINSMQMAMQNLNDRLNRHSEKLDQISEEVRSNSIAAKIVWAVLLALVTSMITMYVRGL